ncbi:hypothetical protein [Ascidiimonas aurantiaca]
MKTIKKFTKRAIPKETVKKVCGGKAKMADKAMNAITQYISS